jgi:hypothetical protein
VSYKRVSVGCERKCKKSKKLLDRPENCGKIEVKAWYGRQKIEKDCKMIIEFIMVALFLSPLLFVVGSAVVEIMRV